MILRIEACTQRLGRHCSREAFKTKIISVEFGHQEENLVIRDSEKEQSSC